MKRNYFLVIVLIIIIHSWQDCQIYSYSIKFIRSIHLKEDSSGKSLGSLLLGKKKELKIKPTSFCRISASRLVVIDTESGRILIIDDNGKIRKKINHFKGIHLVSPVSVCTDHHANIYVSDSALRQVFKLDFHLKFESIFISHPQGRITGITFRQDSLYCVDTSNHRILCFNHEGKLQFSFGKRGTDHGEFNFPTHITADKKFIYVTDAMNFRVQIFNPSGEFIHTFGSNGRSGGKFSKPKGIAVDNAQHIFVADAMFDNVQIFNIKGQFLYYFGFPGQGQGEFWMPSGITIDGDTIWVSDTYNNRIQVFKLLESEK